MIYEVQVSSSISRRGYIVESENIQQCISYFSDSNREITSIVKMELQYINLSDTEISYLVTLRELYTEKTRLYLIFGTTQEIFDHILQLQDLELVSIGRRFGKILKI